MVGVVKVALKAGVGRGRKASLAEVATRSVHRAFPSSVIINRVRLLIVV